MINSETERFEKVFYKFTNKKEVNEGILLIENLNGDYSFSKGYGGKEISSPLLMASITKLHHHLYFNIVGAREIIFR